jgi:hypothetical protein
VAIPAVLFWPILVAVVVVVVVVVVTKFVNTIFAHVKYIEKYVKLLRGLYAFVTIIKLIFY